MGKGHTAALWLLTVAVLVGAAMTAATAPAIVMGAGAASSGGTATFVLDSVNLTLSSPMLPSQQFVTSKPGSVSQVASSSVVHPYREVIVTAVPFGTSPGTEKLPDAHPGNQQSYRSSLVSDRSSQGARPAPGPDASLFGQDISSVVSVLNLHLDGAQPESTVIVEWVAQAGPRMWILRMSEAVAAGEDANEIVSGLSGVTLTSSDPNDPSTLPGSSAQPQPPPSPVPSPPPVPSPAAPLPSPSASPTPTPVGTPSPVPGGLPATTSTPTPAVTQSLVRPVVGSAPHTANVAPAPSWWSGNCDAGNNPGSYPLGSSFDGVVACGPLPINGGTDHLVQFYPGAWGEYEWECVELVMRYLYLVDGVAPYQANGSQVVWNYSGGALVQIGNGTAGAAPIPGDILSYGSTSTNGHSSVVSSVSIDGGGNGTIAVVEENDTSNGTTTMNVSNWVVQGSPYPVSGWLQPPLPHAAARPRYWAATNSDGRAEVFMRGGDGQFWHDFETQAGNPFSWSGWYPMGGDWPGEPVVALDSQGRLEVFARGGDGQLWHAFQQTAAQSLSWSGFYPMGGFWPRDPVVGRLSGGALEVFVVGGDGQAWEASQNNSSSPVGWSGFYPLGGAWPGQPAVAAEADGRLDLFLRGGDGRLWHAYQVAAGGAAGWSGFYPLGADLLGDPVAARNAAGQIEVLVVGASQDLVEVHETSSGASAGWSRFSSLGGTWPSDPTLVSAAGGHLEAFMTGGDGELWYLYETQPNAWAGSFAEGGVWPGDPAATSNGSGPVQVLLVGEDGDLWQTHQTQAGGPSTWSGFSPLGGDWPTP